MRIPLSAIEEFSFNRPPAYKQELLNAGHRVANELEIEAAICATIHVHFPPDGSSDGGRPPDPSLSELALNFLTATARWAKAGFPLRTEAETSQILTICRGSADGLQPACPEWLGDALIPRCRRCGCTALKPWLVTEKCPMQKW